MSLGGESIVGRIVTDSGLLGKLNIYRNPRERKKSKIKY
jgi:hypothetical protein